MDKRATNSLPTMAAIGRVWRYGAAASVAAFVITASYSYSYLLFHIISELFTVVISISVFILVWNARDIMKSDFAFLVGIALVFTAGFDLFHILVYDGMGIFQNFGTNAALQLSIASRFVLACSFLVAPAFLTRRLDAKIALAVFLVIGAGVAQSIFTWQSFPDAYVRGAGLTWFAIAAEAATALIFFATILVYRRQGEHFDLLVRSYMCAFFALIVASDLFVIFLGTQPDWRNATIHVIRVLAYYAIYKAFVEIALVSPYRGLFFELERNNRLKDDILNIVSHDLKTPVTSIKLVADTLEAQLPKGSRERDAAALIGKQAREMGRLLNDFLEYGRIESGRLRLEMSEFELGDLIASCIESVATVSPAHRFLFDRKTGIRVRADKSRTGQILTNILSNAVKYSPGGGEIAVELVQSGGNAEVTVRDSGLGIDPESRKRVFEKYFRTVSGSRRSEGTGLGLYIAKTFVELQGGKIWVESEQGIGSTFHFTLPKAEA